MRKKIIIAIFSLIIKCLLSAQNWDEGLGLAKKYYKLIENPSTVSQAYKMAKRNVTLATYQGWYKDTDIFVPFNYKEIDNYTDGPGDYASKYTFNLIQKEIINGIIKRTFYEITFDEITKFKEFCNRTISREELEASPLIISAKEIQQPISDEEIILREYYAYLERPDKIEKAYEMSTKKVPFETYKSWYTYKQADIKIKITGINTNAFSFLLYFSSFDGEKYDNTHYSVTSKLGKTAILESNSINLSTAAEKLIISFLPPFLKKNYSEAIKFCDNSIKVSDLKNIRENQEYQNIIDKISSSKKGNFVTELNTFSFYYPDENYMYDFYFNFWINNDKISRFSLEFPERGGKPAIYLYPLKQQKVFVNVTTPFGFQTTIPEYINGWNVTAKPDGTIINDTDGKSYPYIFWEAPYNKKADLSQGFVVKKEDLPSFFNEKLAYLGLNDKEINDFKEFWISKLSTKPYYQITFLSQSKLDNIFPLTVTPTPDTIIRVYFDYKGLDAPAKITPQKLLKRERSGFSVIEWGGNLNSH